MFYIAIFWFALFYVVYFQFVSCSFFYFLFVDIFYFPLIARYGAWFVTRGQILACHTKINACWRTDGRRSSVKNTHTKENENRTHFHGTSNRTTHKHETNKKEYIFKYQKNTYLYDTPWYAAYMLYIHTGTAVHEFIFTHQAVKKLNASLQTKTFISKRPR